ncbi:MAG: hypothetical protein WC792_05305 [Candidatus Micrarchaeia archaeon]|jgi:hypothetical protein
MGRFSIPALARKYSVDRNIIIEPVKGCGLQCRQCTMGKLPVERKFMDPQTLDARLSELKEAGLGAHDRDLPAALLRYNVGYTSRGNPLDHENLAQITRVVRKHLPDAKIASFWSLDGVPSKAELVKRTKGLDLLVLSLDSHHYAGLYRAFKQTPQGMGLGPKQLREQTFDLIRDRIGWAFEAAKKNGFSIKVQITRKGKYGVPVGNEGAIFEKLVPTAKSGELGGVKMEVDSRDRRPKGNSNYMSAQSLLILHNGEYSEAWPKPNG